MPVVTRLYKVIDIVSGNEPVMVHNEGVRTKEVTTIRMETVHEADQTPDSSVVLRTLTKEEMYAVGESGSEVVMVRFGSAEMEVIEPTITALGTDPITVNHVPWVALAGRGFVTGSTLVGVVDGNRIPLESVRKSSNLIMFNAFIAAPITGELIVVTPEMESEPWPLSIGAAR